MIVLLATYGDISNVPTCIEWEGDYVDISLIPTCIEWEGDYVDISLFPYMYRMGRRLC